MTVFTIGHSTRSLEALIGLLKRNEIDSLWDVRTAPGSRRLPHFARAVLAESLPRSGIAYRHVKELGGLRKARLDSTNTGWLNASFRGYADYMETPEFEAALAELERTQSGRRLAIMCAEAVPWRCHRSLIADALTARGVDVLDIISDDEPKPHRMTPFAQVVDHAVRYPGNGGAGPSPPRTS